MKGQRDPLFFKNKVKRQSDVCARAEVTRSQLQLHRRLESGCPTAPGNRAKPVAHHWFPQSRLVVPGNAAEDRHVETPPQCPGLERTSFFKTDVLI